MEGWKDCTVLHLLGGLTAAAETDVRFLSLSLSLFLSNAET